MADIYTDSAYITADGQDLLLSLEKNWPATYSLSLYLGDKLVRIKDINKPILIQRKDHPKDTISIIALVSNKTQNSIDTYFEATLKGTEGGIESCILTNKQKSLSIASNHVGSYAYHFYIL